MSSSVPSTVPDCLKLPIDIDGLHQDERPRKTERAGVGGGGEFGRGVIPYIRIIGMVVVFLGVLIGDLVFLRGCSSEIY